MKNAAENRPVRKLSEAEVERYARHIVLREVGGAGQTKLLNARVLVVGAGGLGSPVLQYLAAAGVGEIAVIDDDVVSVSNLQRQVLFDLDQIGVQKVEAAADRLSEVNPHVEIVQINARLTEANVDQLVADYDLTIDGCDNFPTRHLVNAACVRANKPLISGALSQWEGQVSLFFPKINAPCYACVFPTIPKAGLAPSCSEAGVMGALPGIIGSLMASEAIKWITGAGANLVGEMLIFDALYGDSRKVKLRRDPKCSICRNVRSI